MTTGHSPSSGDYDATTALSRFASPQDLERIAETRPDLHSILATNPSIPPRVREILEQSDDAVGRVGTIDGVQQSSSTSLVKVSVYRSYLSDKEATGGISTLVADENLLDVVAGEVSTGSWLNQATSS